MVNAGLKNDTRTIRWSWRSSRNSVIVIAAEEGAPVGGGGVVRLARVLGRLYLLVCWLPYNHLSKLMNEHGANFTKYKLFVTKHTKNSTR